LVIVVLSLVAYRFTDAMTSEYRAGVRAADMAQARAAAAAGIHYTMAYLADRDTRVNQVGDPTFDNPSLFSDILVRPDPKYSGKNARFSIYSVVPLGGGAYERRAAVTDEGGKLNPNALIAIDKTGQVLYNALLKLPNMTPEIADAIVDWVDSD